MSTSTMNATAPRCTASTGNSAKTENRTPDPVLLQAAGEQP